MFGDEGQSATNYPLVRITNLRTHHVFYSRTHDHSSMAVASDDEVSTHFDVPSRQEFGLKQARGRRERDCLGAFDRHRQIGIHLTAPAAQWPPQRVAQPVNRGEKVWCGLRIASVAL